MESFAITLKKTLIDEHKTLTDIARSLKTQPQNLSNKLRRGTITYEDALKIAKLLGYEIKWHKIV